MRRATWFIALVLHPVALSSRAKGGQSARQFGTLRIPGHVDTDSGAM
jgi:hypothetical protein